LLLTVILIFTACSAASRYTWLGEPQPRKPDTCAIDFFHGEKPTRPFMRVARLDVHVERIAWTQPTLDDATQELRKQACIAGADAVIDIEQLTSRYLETRRLHVIGTAIKWTTSP
jgi:hypothetical protein